MKKLVPYSKQANAQWDLWESDDNLYSPDQVLLAVMMDIRAEIRRLNSVLQCPNFISVPSKLDQIARNTKRRKKPRAIGKPKLRVVAHG